jgi:hypothetical protein
MATAKRTGLTLRNRRRRHASPITFLAILNLLTGGGIASADCGVVDFVFPTEGLEFFYLDTINVTYRSDFTSPVLSCWCFGELGRATRS